MRRLIRSRREWLAILCAMALQGALLPACEQGGTTTAEEGDETSGGEDDGRDDGRGERPDRVEQPPGSVEPEPGDDDLEGPDEEPTPGGTTDAGTPATGTPSTPQASPWGTPETQSGAPLPQRREMSGSARGDYERGVQAGQRGDTAAARTAFEAALRADPAAFRAAYNLGVLYDREGNADRAEQYYRQALTIQPDYERAAEGIVTLMVRRGNATGAVSFMEPLARQWVRNLHIQAIYGEALIHANRPAEAITAARAALRRDERFVPAMIVLVKANLRMSPPRTELAESILDQALAIETSNAELHFLKGRQQQQAGQLGPALASFRRAVELRPDYADARMALALQLLAGANYQEAVQQFEAVSRLVSGRPEVHLGLGNAYRSTKQWQKAKAELDRVVAAQPRSAEAHFGLGLMWLEAGDQYPGVDLLTSLRNAQQELQAYREIMGARLDRNDPVATYLEEITRAIEREQRRIERDAARAQREAERAAREGAAASGGGTE